MTSAEATTAELIYHIANLQFAYVKDQLKALHLNPMQARVMKFIALHPGTNQKSIASFLNKHEATITNILKTLEEAQLIERRVHPENEREKQLFLTAQGEDLYAKIQTVFYHLDQQIGQLALPITREQLNSALGLIQSQLQQDNKGA